jgi:hypothetical protein
MRILWHRLLTNPTTRVVSRDGDETRIKVEGLVCDDVCAARTASALRSLEGVERVYVDLDSGVATVHGRHYEAETYARAVAAAVAGKPLRRAIERVASAVRRRRPPVEGGETAP